MKNVYRNLKMNSFRKLQNESFLKKRIMLLIKNDNVFYTGTRLHQTFLTDLSRTTKFNISNYDTKMYFFAEYKTIPCFQN